MPVKYIQTMIFLLGTTLLPAQNDTLQYLFLGHTYDWSARYQNVDFRIEGIDKSPYDQFWLGGDMCSETGQNRSTLEYLDDLFDLSDPKNHWALGNHDHRNGNLEWIQEFTGRNDYYASYQDGITVVVLNSNLNPSDCENLNRQFDMIVSTCDSISESSHLILLNHHNIWPNVPGINPGDLGDHGTLKYYATNCDSVNAYFYNTVYPKLVEVQNRGVQVINIMGDAGWGDPRAKQSDDGIWFMASGVNATFYRDNPAAFAASADEVLLIRHIPAERKLWWVYLSLDELYGE
jgi:hypothetical protein